MVFCSMSTGYNFLIIHGSQDLLPSCQVVTTPFKDEWPGLCSDPSTDRLNADDEHTQFCRRPASWLFSNHSRTLSIFCHKRLTSSKVYFISVQTCTKFMIFSHVTVDGLLTGKLAITSNTKLLSNMIDIFTLRFLNIYFFLR